MRHCINDFKHTQSGFYVLEALVVLPVFTIFCLGLIQFQSALQANLLSQDLLQRVSLMPLNLNLKKMQSRLELLLGVEQNISCTSELVKQNLICQSADQQIWVQIQMGFFEQTLSVQACRKNYCAQQSTTRYELWPRS